MVTDLTQSPFLWKNIGMNILHYIKQLKEERQSLVDRITLIDLELNKINQESNVAKLQTPVHKLTCKRCGGAGELNDYWTNELVKCSECSGTGRI